MAWVLTIPLIAYQGGKRDFSLPDCRQRETSRACPSNGRSHCLIQFLDPASVYPLPSGTALRWHPSREEFLRWCESAHFVVAEEGDRRALKRARPLGEESRLANSDSSIEGAFGSSSSGQQAPVVEPEGMVPSSIVARLREELEASHAEVARLQLTLRGDATHPSAVIDYLRSEAYRHQMEFEQAHHSWSGYIRAISDVAALYLELDLSSLYLLVVIYDTLFCFMLSAGVAHVSEFLVLGRGSPMTAGRAHSQHGDHPSWRIPRVGAMVAYDGGTRSFLARSYEPEGEREKKNGEGEEKGEREKEGRREGEEREEERREKRRKK
ncbi:hypothetical protein ACLOJK_014702, partial [Asimina triloba]